METQLVADVTARQAGFWRRHRALKWTLGLTLLALLALGVAISVALHNAEPMLRAAIVERLEEHFHAHVELDSFHVSLVNGLRAEGKGLRIWPPDQEGGTSTLGPAGRGRPLIQIADFRFRAALPRC